MSRYSVAILIASFFLLSTPLQAEVAPCRMDDEFCSCKWAERDRETCWMQNAPEDNGQFQCEEVSCLSSGWMCSCDDREYVCPVKQTQNTVFLDDSSGVNLCRNDTTRMAGPPILQLGSVEIGLSKKGMLSNACNELALWYNGDMVANYGSHDDPMITCANGEEEIKRRSNHTAVELKRGDLIAFRFKHASYHCFTSMAKFRINGRFMNSLQDDVVTRYARQHSTNWYDPSFRPVYPDNSVNLDNVTEATEPSSIFIPLRRKFFSTGETIQPGEDYWHPPDGSRDHAIGNFYFRIQL